MTAIFSKKCEYGLQAVFYMTAKESGCISSLIKIDRKLKIPKEFVSKIHQYLTGRGIVDSKKRKYGGFILAKNPWKIRLIDIVDAIDGLNIFNSCVLDFPSYSLDKRCSVHHEWGEQGTKAYEMLDAETLINLKRKL